MKCFDIVKTVLDETYKEIDNGDGTADARIRSAIDASSAQYVNKLMEEGGPNFTDAATRFGYVYSYVPAHAYWVYELIEMSEPVQALFDSGKVRMTCIGGGPGSDIVGALKYIDEKKLSCKLFVEIIDGCEEWKATWSDVAYMLDLDAALHTDYVIHDVEDEATWLSRSGIAKSELITLNFFLSEIFHLGEVAKAYLTKMFGSAKTGALVLVNDNRTPELQQFIDAIAKSTGFATLNADEGVRKIWDSSESRDSLKDYSTKFGKSSKLTGKMFLRIYQKQ